MPVAANDRQKTAFISPTGKWEFTRMPFGLKGAPAAFQRRMDETLSTENNANTYIDDVAILSDDWDLHKQDLRGTLQRLRDRGLTCRLAKCKFSRRSLDFLGHTIGKG